MKMQWVDNLTDAGYRTGFRKKDLIINIFNGNLLIYKDYAKLFCIETD